VKELQERIDDAIFFLETEYNTYPSGEAWRKALKNILKGNEIKKLDFSTAETQKEKNKLIKDKINEIIDKLEEIK
jgi:hypothetical protein